MTPQYKAARDEKAEAVADSIDWKNLGDGAIRYKPMSISMWRLGADWAYAQGQAEIDSLTECLIAEQKMRENFQAGLEYKQAQFQQETLHCSDLYRERDEWKQQAEALAKALESRCKQLGVQSDTLAEYAAWKREK